MKKLRILVARAIVTVAEVSAALVAGVPLRPAAQPRRPEEKPDFFTAAAHDVPEGAQSIELEAAPPQARAVRMSGDDVDDILFVVAQQGRTVFLRRPTSQAYPAGAKAKVIQ